MLFYKGAEAAWKWAQDRKPDEVRDSTSFWYLPKELRQPVWDADPETGLGPCCCRYCSPKAGSSEPVAAWDTLAVGDESAWLVHYPELGGAQPKR